MKQEEISWDSSAEENFKQLIAKMPVFVRGMAEKAVAKKAEDITLQDNRSVVGEKDFIDALFSETPFGFHGLMKSDLNELGINYTQYGHPE